MARVPAAVFLCVSLLFVFVVAKRTKTDVMEIEDDPPTTLDQPFVPFQRETLTHAPSFSAFLETLVEEVGFLTETGQLFYPGPKASYRAKATYTAMQTLFWNVAASFYKRMQLRQEQLRQWNSVNQLFEIFLELSREPQAGMQEFLRVVVELRPTIDNLVPRRFSFGALSTDFPDPHRQWSHLYLFINGEEDAARQSIRKLFAEQKSDYDVENALRKLIVFQPAAPTLPFVRPRTHRRRSEKPDLMDIIDPMDVEESDQAVAVGGSMIRPKDGRGTGTLGGFLADEMHFGELFAITNAHVAAAGQSITTPLAYHIPGGEKCVVEANVPDSDGVVQFQKIGTLEYARMEVEVKSGKNNIDVALIKLDDPGLYPVMAGVAAQSNWPKDSPHSLFKDPRYVLPQLGQGEVAEDLKGKCEPVRKYGARTYYTEGCVVSTVVAVVSQDGLATTPDLIIHASSRPRYLHGATDEFYLREIYPSSGEIPQEQEFSISVTRSQVPAYDATSDSEVTPALKRELVKLFYEKFVKESDRDELKKALKSPVKMLYLDIKNQKLSKDTPLEDVPWAAVLKNWLAAGAQDTTVAFPLRFLVGSTITRTQHELRLAIVFGGGSGSLLAKPTKRSLDNPPPKECVAISDGDSSSKKESAQLYVPIRPASHYSDWIFGNHGDSGSLITNSKGLVVALLWGGRWRSSVDPDAPTKEAPIVNAVPIKKVLNSLNFYLSKGSSKHKFSVAVASKSFLFQLQARLSDLKLKPLSAESVNEQWAEEVVVSLNA